MVLTQISSVKVLTDLTNITLIIQQKVIYLYTVNGDDNTN